MDLDFKGGTIGDYVEMVRATSKQVLNFVMPDGIPDGQMPPVTLRSVSISDAVEIIARVARPKGNMRLNVEERAGRGSRTFIIDENKTYVPPFGSPGGGQSGTPPLVTRVYSLNQLVGDASASAARPDATSGLTAAVVLASLEQALSIASPDDAPAEVRYHKDSGLLFVRSTPAQSEVAERAIMALQQDFARPQALVVEHRKTRVFRPTRVQPAELVDAIRVVYPVGMENGPEVDAADGKVGVTAPSRILMGIEALAAYLDAPRTPSGSELQARLEAIGLQEQLAQMRRATERSEMEASRLVSEVRSQQIESEQLRMRAEESAKQAAMLDARSLELDRARQELEQARQRLTELELYIRGQGPKPKDEPR